MNQILTTKQIKPKKNVQIKTVKMIFGICIIIFGICMATSGSYAIFTNRSARVDDKNISSNNTNTATETKNKEIQIHLSVDGANIKATVVGETEISYVTYKWDDEEEIRQDINSVSEDVTIEIPEGQHTLTITAVDINNNTETKEQQVKGVVKPKLEVTHDKEHSEFVIKSSDEIGLDKFEFILNGQPYRYRVEGEKEKEFRYPLVEGDNTLEVKAYNTEGATETFKALIHN